MNQLQDGKVSFNMKDALTRNNIEEQNMKSNIKSLQCVNKKELDALKYKQALYQKRQAQLKLSLDSAENRPRSAYEPRSPRSPNSPLTRVQASGFNIRKNSEPGFQSITEMHTGNDIPSRPRSISVYSARSPSIEISDFDQSGSGDSSVKLPSISPSGNNLTAPASPRIRRKSTEDLSRDVANFLKRPLTPSNAPSEFSFLVNTPSESTIWSKSAPSSPAHTRKAFPMPGNQLPKFKTRQRSGSAQGQHIDCATLAESLEKIKFCKYLRGSEKSLVDEEEMLPQELIPRTLVIGHTKMPGIL